MIDTLCHVLQCTTQKEITKCMVCGHREVMYGNSHACIKSDALSAQPRENSNIERNPFQLHPTQWDVFEKHMIP